MHHKANGPLKKCEDARRDVCEDGEEHVAGEEGLIVFWYHAAGVFCYAGVGYGGVHWRLE
jgi:hypothetical protein